MVNVEFTSSHPNIFLFLGNPEERVKTLSRLQFRGNNLRKVKRKNLYLQLPIKDYKDKNIFDYLKKLSFKFLPRYYLPTSSVSRQS